MDSLILQTAPPLDPAWLAFEEEYALNKPRQELPIAEHQAAYAAECRSLNAKMLTPGARDHLSLNVTKTEFTVPSTLASPSVDEANRYQIPVIRYQHATGFSASDGAAVPSPAQPDVTVLYIHGGGLYVGKGDSEELSCLRILKTTSSTKEVNDTKSHLIRDVYSLTYRLMPTYSAQDSLSDCLSVLIFILNQHQHGPNGNGNKDNNQKLILAGSSSGGQLAALVSQHASTTQGTNTIHGALLRCPVISDAFSGLDPYVPLRFRHLHTSAWDPSFWNSLLGQMKRAVRGTGWRGGRSRRTRRR